MAIYTKPLNHVWQDDPPASQQAIGDLPDAEHNIDFSYGESAKDRRNRIAEGFAFALSGTGYLSREFSDLVASTLAKDAVGLADALIAELDK